MTAPLHQYNRPPEHAVSQAGASAYSYDPNGNMTSRPGGSGTQTLTYGDENRLVTISGGSTASFAYDADGNRVWQKVGATETTYVWDWVESGTVYYYFGGRKVAMRAGSVSYLYADHLTSTSGTNGGQASSQLYYPYGAKRSTESVATPYRYTGQRWEEALGLYFYNARWYDPALGRFLQPDTLVPEPGNPQALNRYSYTLNNPVKYNDPSGHAADASGDAGCEHDALWYLISLIAQGDTTALARLEQILAGSYGTNLHPKIPPHIDSWIGSLLRTQLRGIGAHRGDSGFASEFQDEWYYQNWWSAEYNPQTTQIGHFLTAVSMGMRGGWVHSITGHEQYGDSGLGIFVQVGLNGGPASQRAFLEAVERDAAGDTAGRDELLLTILDPERGKGLENRKGNSLEDLRLSVRGWRLGQMVASGQIGSNKELANWIALNVGQQQ